MVQQNSFAQGFQKANFTIENHCSGFGYANNCQKCKYALKTTINHLIIKFSDLYYVIARWFLESL